MCLYNNYEAAVQFVKKYKKLKKEYIWAWKVISYWNKSIYYNYKWKIGVNKAETRAKSISKNGVVYNGIHVCLTKERVIGILYYSRKLIKVKCYIKDLIGYSPEAKEAVFSKVYVKSLKFQY